MRRIMSGRAFEDRKGAGEALGRPCLHEPQSLRTPYITHGVSAQMR